jgi:hypothetical protein
MKTARASSENGFEFVPAKSRNQNKITQHDHLNNARKQSKAIFFYNLQIFLGSRP